MMRARRPSSRGFTLVELLVVIVLVGVLAGIAMVVVGQVRERTWKASMKSDLHRLVLVQEAFYDSTMYARRRGPRYGNLRQITRAGFTPSPGVTLQIRANTTGWSARARHQKLHRRERCALYLGTIRPFTPAQKVGLITCT